MKAISIKQVQPNTTASSRSIYDIEPGDFVKFQGKLFEIDDIWGISKRGRLAKPSKGGFYVETTCGMELTMWQAEAYYKKEDVK
jgi:hypothetical protein